MATVSKELEITTEGVYNLSISLIPNGKTVLPTNDIQTWLECADIHDKNYTTLAQVLNDVETYERLLSDSNACDYMKRSSTWAGVSGITDSQYAMNLLGRYDYACEVLLSDATWTSAIANSTYWESVLQPLVPAMTSNTTPSGTVSGSTLLNASFDYYKSVNGANETCVLNPSANPKYWQYEFNQPVRVNAFKTQELNNTSSVTTNSLFKSGTIKGSTDGTTWDTLCTMSHTVSAGVVIKYNFTSDKAYKYLKLDDLVCDSTSYLQIGKLLQFYGRHEAKTNIIHSAAQDSVYYLDENNNPVTICITDANGVGNINWSALTPGTYTLYSTVAKDPNNLSDEYHKALTITPNTTELYLMPAGALYWYGYNSNIEVVTESNGWTYTSSLSGKHATFNTNDIYLDTSADSLIGQKLLTDWTEFDTIKFIVNGTKSTWRATSKNMYINSTFFGMTSIGTTYGTTGLATGDISAITGDNSIVYGFSGDAGAYVYAIWYE